MSMREGSLALFIALAGTPALSAPEGPRLGQPLEPAAISALDITVFPDGTGLPPGQGTAVEGKAVYEARCAACHGPNGRGGSAEELAGGRNPLTSVEPDKTIGTYWPYASTVFDFIRRSMPLDAPRSLSDDETYALTAYLLHANGIIGERDPINASTLPKIRMPNAAGFVWAYPERQPR
ncbi:MULTISPECIES: c-type cytochrome [Methylococcus]|jgi:cytochrome c|uniref:c-type cytochrome n=1 Tax=Methylococcus TaxID=413 RepID=UPI001E4E8C07|nr:cytochrome c [Methylococcus capsulatus]UQN12821.1 cytochrome c [Methylococcus capsulatus]